MSTLGSFVRACASRSVVAGAALVIACSARAETLTADVQVNTPSTWKRDTAPRDLLGKNYGKLLAAYSVGEGCYVQVRRNACASEDACGEMDFTKDGLWSDANEHLDLCCETDECRAAPSAPSTKRSSYKCGDRYDVQPPTETLARVRRRRDGGALTVEVGEFFTKISKGRYATLVVAATCGDAEYQKRAPEIDAFIKSIAFGGKRKP